MHAYLMTTLPGFDRIEATAGADMLSVRAYDEVNARPPQYRDEDEATWLLPPVRALQHRHEVRLSRADMLAVADGDHAYLGYMVSNDDKRVGRWVNGRTPLTNLYGETRASRASPSVHMYRMGLRLLFGVLVPFMAAPMQEWALLVPAKGMEQWEIDGCTVHTQPNDDLARAKHLPSISLSCVPGGVGVQLLHAQVLDANGAPWRGTAGTVYFEATAGVLGWQRAAIDPATGIAVAQVATHGLPPGLPVKVKAGFKHYPGLTDCTFDA